MAINTLVTRGYGNGTYSGTVALVVRRGYVGSPPAMRVLGWRVPAGNLHYTIPDSNLHYRIPGEKLQFTVNMDALDWRIPGDNLHWTQKDNPP